LHGIDAERREAVISQKTHNDANVALEAIEQEIRKHENLVKGF
jgi:hypothetical protein